jgi:hypothetical protein
VAQIQLEAHIQAESTTKAAVGLHMGLSVGIVVPASAGFGPAPVHKAKNTLKILSMDVTPKKGE